MSDLGLKLRPPHQPHAHCAPRFHVLNSTHALINQTEEIQRNTTYQVIQRSV